MIREAVGRDMDLICDVNQRWRVEQAIDIGKGVEDAGVGLFWLEDVTMADDFTGLAGVAAALSTPVAVANTFGASRRSATCLRRARHLDDRPGASRRHQPMVQDRLHGGSLQPAGGHLRRSRDPCGTWSGLPNGLTVECMPRLFRLFEEVPIPENGGLAMPAATRLGLKFNEETIRRFGVA